jgi:hypothetical protein
MMNVYCNGMARVKNKSTGAIFDIENDELEWNVVSADERQMGPETCFQATVEHPDLGTLSWSLWEYPQGIENYRESNVGGHEVVEDFHYGLEHAPEREDWVDYDVPDDPYTIFMDSYHRTGDMLADHGRDDGRYLLNRMVFSHHVTALEAYLGDTLIKAVLSDRSAMVRVMTDDKDLAREKFSLADIATNPDLVEKTIRDYLRSLLYHNLPKVDFLYSTALQFRILDLPMDKDRLFQAIKYRHDCVHRNGFDADGNELTIFTKEFVQETSDHMKYFVGKIQMQIRAKYPSVLARGR